MSGHNGRKALVGMAMIPVEGLDARVGRPGLRVGIRRWFVVMHMMTKVLAMHGKSRYDGVTPSF